MLTSVGHLMPLADCGGGGNDLAALLVILVAFSAWLLVAALVLRAARGDKERYLLLGLLIGTILLTPLIISAFYSGLFGDDGDTGKLALLLLLPSVIGLGIAYLTRGAHMVRALFISVWGTILIPFGIYFAFFAAFAIGNGCLE
jgi:hypothetical protein